MRKETGNDMEPPEDGAAEETARPDQDRSATPRSSGQPGDVPAERGGTPDGDDAAVDGVTDASTGAGADEVDGNVDADADRVDGVADEAVDGGAGAGADGVADADGVDGVGADGVTHQAVDAGADGVADADRVDADGTDGVARGGIGDAEGREAEAAADAGDGGFGGAGDAEGAEGAEYRDAPDNRVIVDDAGSDGPEGSDGYDDLDDESLDADAYGGSGHFEDDGILDGTEELGGIAQLSVTSRLIVALAVAAVAVGAAFHLGMVFLSVSPPNTLSDEYSQQVNDYVLPEFEQNWKLFAPNPVQENNDVEARAEIRESDGSLTDTGWVDLTAMDIAKIRHDPIPSHTVQNELRRAWGFYTDTHDGQDRGIGLRGDLSQEYMLHIVAQRLGPKINGDPVQELQVRVATEPVGSPPWDSEKIPTTTSYRVLPWWAVTAEDYT